MPSNSLDNLIGKSDIKGLKTLLVQTFTSDACAAISKALAELGFKPEHDDVGAIISILNRDFTQVASIGVPAIAPLVILLKDRKTYENSFNIVHNVDENGELGGDSYELIDTIRKDAEATLVTIGSDAVPVLVEILIREGFSLGYAFEPILSVLVEIGDPRAMDGFLYLLKSKPDIEVYEFSVFWSFLPKAVRKYNDRRVIPYCLQYLADRKLVSRVQGSMVSALMELGENRLPEGVCYFCGKRPARPESVFKQLMMEKVQVIEHKSVVNTPGGMDVRANKLKQTYFDIPRCAECKTIHEQASKSTNLPAMLMAFGGSALALVLFWGHGAIWWAIGFWFVFAIIADKTVVRIILRKKFREHGILGPLDTQTHPKVIQGVLKGQEWGVGK